MAFVTCENCGQKTSDKRGKCPKCGNILVELVEEENHEDPTIEEDNTTNSVEDANEYTSPPWREQFLFWLFF